MTFRSPLRNEWMGVEPQFQEAARGRGDQAVMARVMLDVVPAFISAVERERDKGSTSEQMFNATAAACGCLIENAIAHHPSIYTRHNVLQRMLGTIDNAIKARWRGQASRKLLTPGG